MTSSPRIVIIGTGIGGLTFAIALKRQLGYDNFVIYEKASDVGGTWRDNIYPGCSSDTPMHYYCLSTDLNPDWSYSHAYHDEIQAYWGRLTDKYALSRHIVFSTKVVSAMWDRDKQIYHIVTEDVASGKRTSATANIVVSAIGILEVPRFPDIPGVSNFKGQVFHSGRWDKSVALQGKRVAVVGNGASATQFVPHISESPDIQVTQFCRTPNWFLPPIRREHSSNWKWALRHVPFLLRFWRALEFLRTEVFYFTIFKNKMMRRFLAKWAELYIMQNAPAQYSDKIIPKYELGCKRLIFDTHYLSALHRPNMSLNWDGIASIVEDGILTKKGETIPFDVLIFATGYTADRYPIHIQGTSQTVQQYYDSQGGPKAYIGTTVPGFPNFYMVSGPNTTTGHTSVAFSGEVQVDYIIQLIKPVIDKKVSSFEVTARATDAYNVKIHDRLSRSVHMTCNSWYRTGGDGRITSIFPGASSTFWWWLRRPNWDHYVAAEGDRRWPWHLRRQRLFAVSRRLAWLGSLGVLCRWAFHRLLKMDTTWVTGDFMQPGLIPVRKTLARILDIISKIQPFA